MIVNSDELFIEQEVDIILQTSYETLKPDLPLHNKVNLIPNSDINYTTGGVFTNTIQSAYNEIIHWRKNLFKLPSGKAAKLFITELTTEFHGIALKVFMVLPAMIMQKPSKSSKAKEHLIKLDERLKLWKEGRISDLMHECRVIQKRLLSLKKREAEDTARIFSIFNYP